MIAASLGDISTGGALICGVPPTLSSRVQVRVEGVGYQANVVLHEASGVLRLPFAADPVQQARLAALVERLARSEAA